MRVPSSVNRLLQENSSDKELVSAALGGNNEAFAIIIRNTQALVTQIVFKMVDDYEDRRDLSQEVYLLVYKNLRGFRFGSKLSTWVGQIAYNTCINFLRRKKVNYTFTWNESEESESMKDIDAANTPFYSAVPDLDRKNCSIILQKAINQLPPLYRTIITLYHSEEQSYKEIAEITGLPEGTLKSYLFRARKALKNELLIHYKFEDL